MYIAIDGGLRVLLLDTVKKIAKAIDKLHDMGIEVAMITGDNERTAQAIGKQMGIDRILAEVLPEDRPVVKKLQNEARLLQWWGME